MTKATRTKKTIMDMIVTRKRIETGYRKYRRLSRLSIPHLLILIVIAIAALSIGYFSGQNRTLSSATVSSVVDGDTVRVSLNNEEYTVRLLGIDSPETQHPTKPVGCFGPEAHHFTQSQLEGKEVELEFDAQRYDKYNRILAYVYIDGTRFNDVLVEQGYATILSIEPNTKYEHVLMRKEIQAQNNERGLWGYCVNDN